MDVTTLALAVDSTQVNTAASALDKFAASGTKAEGAATRLSKATADQGKSLLPLAKGADKAALSFKTLEEAQAALGGKGSNRLAAAAAELGLTQTKADAATASMVRLGEAAQTAGAKTQAALSGTAVGTVRPGTPTQAATVAAPVVGAATAGAARAIVKGNEDIAKSAKLAAFQQQQLGFQIHDFAVQVMSGQSPLTAFVQQGSQLSGTFGGAGNAFRAITALITPMRLAIGAAAAGVGVLALAMSHAESVARDLATVQAQLAATGREGAFNDQGLKEFIEALAKAPGVTREAATGIVSELSKIKGISGDLFRDLAQDVVNYAKATGKDLPAAAKEMAKAFAEPGRGAQQLGEAFDKITSAQIRNIETLDRQGKTLEAQKALYAALHPLIKGVADNAMTPLAKSTNDLGNAWERAMGQMDKSDGLRNLNALLGKMIGAITWVIDHADEANAKIRPLLAFASLGGSEVARSVLGRQAASAGGATGSWTDAQAASGASSRGTVNPNASIKSTLDATIGFKAQSEQIAELTDTRKRLNDEIKKSIELDKQDASLKGKPSADTKALQSRLGGVDERIASIKKRGASGGNEAQQVLDEQLQRSLKASRNALEQERDNIAFSQRFLQGVYQAGEISLKDFYEEKRKAIQQGVAAELAELDKERTAVQAHLEATKRTSPKDKSALEKDTTRLEEIKAQADKLAIDGARAQTVATQEQTAATKQLNEQVLNYRANLLQLQGDEIGAAKIRAQIAEQQLSVLAKQSQGSDNPADRITAGDHAAAKRATDQQIALTAARLKTSGVNDILQQSEERIALAQKTGAIGEIQALQQLGSVRAQAVAELEKIVQENEKLAAQIENKDNYQLQIDTSRARLELEKLRAELDPLKEKFDNLFKDTGATFFETLMNGGKPKDAIKAFGASISKELNSIASKQLSEQVFGKDGILGGLGGKFAEMVGGKKNPLGESAGVPDDVGIFGNKNKPSIDTSGVQQSFTSLQASGIDPTISAFSRLVASIDSAGNSLSTNGIPKPSGDTTTLPTGDFARLDRGQTSGEDSVMELFRDAGKANENYAASNLNASNAAMQFANAAAKGGNALGLLPSLIGLIQSAITSLTTSSSSSSGGNLLGSLFSGGSGASSFEGLGGGAGNYNFGGGFARGGYTGDKDAKKVAGVVHSKEYVFNSKAVETIGRSTLETIHEKAAKGEKSAFAATPKYHTGGIVGKAADRAVPMLSVKGAAGGIGGAGGAGGAGGHAALSAFAAGGAGGRGGDGADMRKLATGSVFADAPPYHQGGIVAGAAKAANLKPNEVRAVLLKNEEVLTEQDPRHRKNMTQEMKGAFATAPKYHTGGIVGRKADDRIPALLKAPQRQYLTAEKDDKAKAEGTSAKAGDTVNFHFSIPNGMTQSHAVNVGRAMGREAQNTLARRSKNT